MLEIQGNRGKVLFCSPFVVGVDEGLLLFFPIHTPAIGIGTLVACLPSRGGRFVSRVVVGHVAGVVSLGVGSLVQGVGGVRGGNVGKCFVLSPHGTLTQLGVDS